MITNNLQDIAFEILAGIPRIKSEFYFTGGTALSLCHLQHRVSVDIDLFCNAPIDRGFAEQVKNEIERNGNMKVESLVRIHDRYTYLISGYWFNSIIDLVNYPFERLEKSWKFYEWIEVDSIRDILANKWFTLFDRKVAKDIVDIVFMAKQWHAKTDDSSLLSIAKDVNTKFGFRVKPRVLREQFIENVKTVNFDRLKGSLLLDMWDPHLFKDHSDYPGDTGTRSFEI